MKQYLADILTFSRFILAIALIILAFTSVNAEVGFLMFVIAELTDAFDGTCAAKWPFPKNKTPKYRKYAAKYDILADTLTALAVAIFFTLRVNLVAGLAILFGYGVFSLAIELIVYGKFFGHPDDFSPRSLMAHNFKRAKKLILARRSIYLILIAVVAVWLLYVSSWSLIVKNIIIVVAAFVAAFLWFFLSQRRHNISRDAVEIEKKLSK